MLLKIYYVVNAVYKSVMVDTLAKHDNNGVVAGDGTQYFGHVTVVDVVSNGTGVTWASLDNSEVAREIDG